MDNELVLATFAMTLVPPVVFFGWIALSHPSEGKVTWGIGVWFILLLIYGWYLLGNPEAYFDTNFLAPLITFIVGVVTWIGKYQKIL